MNAASLCTAHSCIIAHFSQLPASIRDPVTRLPECSPTECVSAYSARWAVAPALAWTDGLNVREWARIVILIDESMNPGLRAWRLRNTWCFVLAARLPFLGAARIDFGRAKANRLYAPCLPTRYRLYRNSLFFFSPFFPISDGVLERLPDGLRWSRQRDKSKYLASARWTYCAVRNPLLEYTGANLSQSHPSEMIRPSKSFQVMMRSPDVIRDANYGSRGWWGL
jgi:hypothetical protein